MVLSVISLCIAIAIWIIKSKKLKLRPLDKKEWALAILSGMGFIVVFAIEGNKYLAGKRAEKDAKYQKNYGSLSPQKTDNKELVWALGNAIFKFPDGVFDLAEIPVEDVDYFGRKIPENPFSGVKYKASISNNKISVNTSLLDEKGNLIAEMQDNEWLVNRNFSIDRNFDNTALEVKDNSGDVIFQIEIVKNIVYLKGKFMRPDGFIAMAASKKTHSGRERGYHLVFKPPKKELEPRLLNLVSIDPIFKYPSELHKGERVQQ